MATDTSPGHAATLTVDLPAIARNWQRLAEGVAPAECAAVVKADAYGLGLRWVAPALWLAGARTFFVAHLEEAIALRPRLPREATIAVLGGLVSDGLDVHAEQFIMPVLNNLEELELWRRFNRDRDVRVPAALHLDTGMNRLGLSKADQARLVEDPDMLVGASISLYMTHFVCADVAGSPLTHQQADQFMGTVAALPAARLSLCNSSGIFRLADRGEMVRPGCALFGVNPTPETQNPMEPVVALEAPILQVRGIDAGESVGYGAIWTSERPSQIATLSIGYADGFLRASNGGTVRIADHECPIVGRVSMDLITVDVTDVPPSQIQPGARAVILDSNRTVDDLARDAGTIGYEVLTNLGHRYRRVYKPVD